MDRSGKIDVTKRIVFTPSPDSLWTSPRTGTTYPLRWKIEFPGRNLALDISPVAKDQEMAVISSSDSIWEGDCKVKATRPDGTTTTGVAYLELVGYNSGHG
jgi:predicted secreted hydrolase